MSCEKYNFFYSKLLEVLYESMKTKGETIEAEGCEIYQWRLSQVNIKRLSRLRKLVFKLL